MAKLKAEQAAKEVSLEKQPNQRPLLTKLKDWFSQLSRLRPVHK